MLSHHLQLLVAEVGHHLSFLFLFHLSGLDQVYFRFLLLLYLLQVLLLHRFPESVTLSPASFGEGGAPVLFCLETFDCLLLL